MTVVIPIWLVVLSVLLYLVYRRAEQGLALRWGLDQCCHYHDRLELVPGEDKSVASDGTL